MNKQYWDSIRAQFPINDKYVYLNAAEASPIPKTVLREAIKFYSDMANKGDIPWDDWYEEVERIRREVALFIGGKPKGVGFTLNTSHGMNIVADLLLGKGEVITMEEEFPATTIPWLHRKYKIHFVQPVRHRYNIHDIEKTITDKTKILVTSYVQYCTGFKQDIKRLGQLCKERNVFFIVNATQAAGILPINVKEANIDFLVFSGYKWTLSGHGIGVLYINPSKRTLHKFPNAGWNSVTNPYNWDNKNVLLRKETSEIELGNYHFPNILALGAAIKFLNSIGINNIEKRVYRLNKYLVKQLNSLNMKIISPLEKKHRSGITIVKIKNPKLITQKLKDQNIIVSTRGEGIRICIHIYNNKKDIDTLISALKDL